MIRVRDLVAARVAAVVSAHAVVRLMLGFSERLVVKERKTNIFCDAERIELEGEMGFIALIWIHHSGHYNEFALMTQIIVAY